MDANVACKADAPMRDDVRFTVRPLAPDDHAQWRVLWDGYNAFYGRRGDTALPAHVTRATWRRLLAPDEPMHALVAERAGTLVGLAHFLFHRSTTRIADACYLADLFTSPDARGAGIGGALVEAVVAHARTADASGVYWQTHESNTAARRLYDALAVHAGYIVYDRLVGG